MISGSRKENIEPWKKLPPSGKKNNTVKIHLDRVKRNSTSPSPSYTDNFISLHMQASKSSSSFRESTAASTETLVEFSEIKHNSFCSGCSVNSNDCTII